MIQLYIPIMVQVALLEKSPVLKQRGWCNFADISDGLEGILKSSIQRTEYVYPTTFLQVGKY